MSRPEPETLQVDAAADSLRENGWCVVVILATRKEGDNETLYIAHRGNAFAVAGILNIAANETKFVSLCSDKSTQGENDDGNEEGR